MSNAIDWLLVVEKIYLRQWDMRCHVSRCYKTIVKCKELESIEFILSSIHAMQCVPYRHTQRARPRK